MRFDDVTQRKRLCNDRFQTPLGQPVQDQIPIAGESFGLVPDRGGDPAAQRQALQRRRPVWVRGWLAAPAPVDDDDPLLGGGLRQGVDLGPAHRIEYDAGAPAGGDTLNLYDNGAVGEAELLQAMQQAGGTPVIAPHVLLADMAAQLRAGEGQSAGDPFGLGMPLGQGDATPHAFGLAVTDALYQHYGGTDAYRAFGQEQMNFALGANGWGSSFVVGAGDTYPHCMQSGIANLAGSLTGHGAIQAGATTDGPSAIGNFVGLGTVAGMRACHAGSFKPFNTKTTGY